MAAPVTHVVLAEKVFDNYFSDKSKKEFFLGTLFPDIRYLGVIGRSQTHVFNPQLKEIKKKDSFFAGLEFHSLIDKARAKFIRHNSRVNYFFELIRKMGICGKPSDISRALKFLEDCLFYEKIKNWRIYLDFLEEILLQELTFGLSRKTVGSWHQVLEDYLSQKPDNSSIEKYFLRTGGTRKRAGEIKEIIEKTGKNKEICQEIERFYQEFEKMIF